MQHTLGGSDRHPSHDTHENSLTLIHSQRGSQELALGIWQDSLRSAIFKLWLVNSSFKHFAVTWDEVLPFVHGLAGDGRQRWAQ